MYKHVIFILLVSSIFGWISFDIHVMKSEATLIGAISSILFVIIMFFYSAYMGKQNYVNFALFITKYWGIGLFIYLAGYFMFLALVFYPANFLFTIPIYGAIRYFFDVLPSVSVGIFSIFFLYFTCLVGYFVGRLK
ncbi:hypothetical protein [Desertibacillus haloalkaliphilus]|uniref:hypothetical protein n=1 Tax=Desertibacillus haloalkaliphilus TaxID=1328930 RepID=UPI001C265AF3|nr:hypothetical protein [Desertibacillus haloalkaliphilus]MBU8906266.1 hypothetical protein [Desertibacillus haloalkaliphilus]